MRCFSDSGAKIIYRDQNSRIQHIKNDQIEFSIDLPGAKSSNTTVKIHDGVLKVISERKYSNDRTTKFERHFPAKCIVDEESNDVHATLVDGLLRITFPKKAEKGIEEVTTSSQIPVLVDYPPDAIESDTSKDIRFSVDLPGVSMSNVSIGWNDDTITLHATRNVIDKVTSTKRNFTFDLDKVDVNSFKAYLVDGVLTVIGLKKTLPEPRRIAVDDGATPEPNTALDTSPAVEAAESKEKEEEDDMVVVETVADEPKQK